MRPKQKKPGSKELRLVRLRNKPNLHLQVQLRHPRKLQRPKLRPRAKPAKGSWSFPFCKRKITLLILEIENIFTFFLALFLLLYLIFPAFFMHFFMAKTVLFLVLKYVSPCWIWFEFPAFDINLAIFLLCKKIINFSVAKAD